MPEPRATIAACQAWHATTSMTWRASAQWLREEPLGGTTMWVYLPSFPVGEVCPSDQQAVSEWEGYSSPGTCESEKGVNFKESMCLWDNTARRPTPES